MSTQPAILDDNLASDPLTPAPAAPSLAEFFEMGQQESYSPFLKEEARLWSLNLELKAALFAAFGLALSFGLSFVGDMAPLSKMILAAVYFLVGVPALIDAADDLAEGDINIDILMTLAAFSSIFIGNGMEGALLLVLFAISGAMENAVTAKAKSTISALNKLSPTRGTVVLEDGRLIERAVQDIGKGTKLLVKAGQVIPLDGIIMEGTSSINLVHLTGENVPVTKSIGDNVPAGGRNLDGALVIEVTHSSQDSTLSRIIELVTKAQEAKPALQQWFDRLSRGYAMSIIALGALFATSFPFFFDMTFLGNEGSLYRSLAFLIAASPCALIIAIPIAYLSAISSCARQGILLKGGISLDALAKCRSIAFDKTGTLTSGELLCLGVERICPISASQEQEKIDRALALAYALEKNALHPVASAIVRYVEPLNLKKVALNSFKAIPGFGVQALVESFNGQDMVYLGSPSYILEKLPQQQRDLLQKAISSLEPSGELLAVLSLEEEIYLFRFSDRPRPHAGDAIAAIKKRGFDIVMLTGDNKQNASRIAAEVGIDHFYADLKPEDKLQHVARLADEKGLAMVGDGINDAPALARATIGICMGKVGSTAAMDAADVILLHDNIDKLDWLIDKAINTEKIVQQNLALALMAIILASIPALAGFIPLWLAVIMHEGGTVIVGLNGLRLLR